MSTPLENPEDAYRFIVDMSLKQHVDAKNLHDFIMPEIGKVQDETAREDLRQALIDMREGAELLSNQLERLGRLMGWKPPPGN